MNITKVKISDSRVKLSVIADPSELTEIKQSVVKKLGRELKLQGFRAGKAPEAMIEKNLSSERLQSDFLDAALNQLYSEAVTLEKIRPVDRPEVNVKKFVPFTTLEFEVEVDNIGKITMPDYKKTNVDKPTVKVTEADIDGVIDQLLIREATKKPVTRDAKISDEVWIDFTGVDAKTKSPITGADGKDYPLILGSNTFIPGFEPELVGLKTGANKTFDIVFPKDYSVSSLQNKKVSFTIKVNKVSEVVKPKIDNDFVKKVGPFNSVAEMRADIKAQLQSEKSRETRAKYENDLVSAITDATVVAIPKILVDDQIDLMERDEKQNLIYRGTTWEEHLKDEGVDETAHRERNRVQAEHLVKMGLVLSEIAEKEQISVTPEELEIRLKLLKGQYKDKQMQEELDKPENTRSLVNQILTEKTLAKLTSYFD